MADGAATCRRMGPRSSVVDSSSNAASKSCWGRFAFGSKHSCHVLLMTEAAIERDLRDRHIVIAQKFFCSLDPERAKIAVGRTAGAKLELPSEIDRA